MHWNHESSKWRLLKVRTLPWTSNPTLRKVDVCPASNVSLQKQCREACGLSEECSVRPVRKQQWQRLWRFIPPPISSLQITAQKFYLPNVAFYRIRVRPLPGPVTRSLMLLRLDWYSSVWWRCLFKRLCCFGCWGKVGDNFVSADSLAITWQQQE